MTALRYDRDDITTSLTSLTSLTLFYGGRGHGGGDEVVVAGVDPDVSPFSFRFLY